MFRMRHAGAVLASLALLSGCAAAPAAPSVAPSGSAPGTVAGEITVFAAASLKGAFTDISTEFGKRHPETTVTFSFDGSNSLVDQLDGGARADVLATADQPNMDRAVSSQLVAPPQRFATNVLTVVTPPDNPGQIAGFDSSLDGKRLVICAPAVPCGNATAKLAQASGLTLKPVSEESKVTDVLGKVTSGEADAGLVYTTDAAGAGAKVKTFPIANADLAKNDYPIAVVDKAGNKAGGEAFSAFVRSAEGQAILATYGFGKP